MTPPITVYGQRRALPLMAALVIGAGASVTVERREGGPSSARTCWEECAREIAGRCFLWKKRCETIPDLLTRPRARDPLDLPAASLPPPPDE